MNAGYLEHSAHSLYQGWTRYLKTHTFSIKCFLDQISIMDVNNTQLESRGTLTRYPLTFKKNPFQVQAEQMNMPELPEVETTRRGIEPHIKGHTIQEVIVREPGLRWPVPDNINHILSGKTIRHVKRRAKYLLLDTGSGHLILHLGMSGSLRILKKDTPPQKHDHIDIILTDGQRLRYTDPRRFGAVLWSESPLHEHKLLKNLGPEPLDSEFTAQHLYQMSRGKSQSVKTLIMDNKVVVGVGNIYASEALFNAGIRPDRACGKISRNRYERLVEAIKETLSRAIEQGGTTLRDFVGGDGKPGYFKQELAVYGRTGQPCLKCGKIIQEIKLGNRSSCYCSHCQR